MKKDLLKIGFADNICGDNKTEIIVNYVRNQITNQLKPNITTKKSSCKFLCANLIIPLAVEFKERLGDLPNVFLITRDHIKKGESVVGKIIEAANIINHDGYGVIISTHKSVFNLLMNYNTDPVKDFDGFFDEVNNDMVNVRSICIPYEHKLLTKYIKLNSKNTSTIDPELCKVKLHNKNELIQHLENSCDDVHELLKPIFEENISGYDVLVDKSSWDKIVVDRNISKHKNNMIENELNSIHFISAVSPFIFSKLKSATFISANFKTSMIYIWWSRLYSKNIGNANIVFEQSKIIKKTKDKHENGHRIECIYYYSEDDWSAYKGNQKITVDGKVMTKQQHFIMLAEELMKDRLQSSVAVYNKRTKIQDKIPYLLEIPAFSHGLNGYSDKDNICIFSTYNKRPSHYNVLRAAGYTLNEIRNACNDEVYYQVTFRTSVRKDDNTYEILPFKGIWVVPDKTAAISMSNRFTIPIPIKLMDGGQKKKSKANNNKKEYIKNYQAQDEFKDKRKIYDNSPKANKLNLLNKNIRSNNKILDELLNEINSTKETIQSNGESNELLKMLDKLVLKEKNVLAKLEKYKQELIVFKQNKPVIESEVIEPTIDESDNALAKFKESVKKSITNLSADRISEYANIMETLEYNMILDEIYDTNYIPNRCSSQHIPLR